MNCPACQHENRDGARFCEECASPLERACPECGVELRPTAKFCDECGTPVAGRAAGAAKTGPQQRGNPNRTAVSDDSTRKVVTIVFADLAGSTALHERLDAESARQFMEGYYRAMRGAVERHGGKVAKLLGDGVMAVFGLPLVAEDDAIRAVRAAVDMQRVFGELAERHSNLVGKVGLRVAANTGEVVARDETELIGDPVNVAARLQDQARDGDVVIGESTRRLVSALITLEPLGSLALKGRAEAVSAYRVVSLERPASATTAAFVGRDEELARLTAVHDAATRTPAARLTVLLGSPGLGKSRLIAEFVSRVGDRASVITGHCDPAGGNSFAPVSQALRRFLGIDDSATAEATRATVDAAVSGNDSDRDRIVDGITALLGGSPASPEETFFVVRRLFAALAATRPVVLVIDDLHWAEPLLLDLVEHLVQWGAGVPLFVLVGARPELRDTRSSLATSGGVVADVVTLAGLDAGAAMRLAANMVGAADLPAAVAGKVLASSEGNPLFVGELVRMLVHEGALKREGNRWTVGAQLAALEMPPTIHALLAARIERLRPEDRAVLERAAVVGRHFSRSAVSALLPRDIHDLDARLESLRRSELIEPDTGWFLGEPVLRFHHLLIRDAAYRRLLKGTRAELHGKLADWVEAKTGDGVEHDETLGWHLEQAWLHLRELGPLDDRGRATGEKAARHLAAAGRRALARDDLSLAAGLLGRALPCLDATDASRAELALDWCEAVLAAGDVATATSAIAELDRFTGASPRLRAWHTCFSGQLTTLTAPQSLQETADAVAAAAENLAALGDDAGEAKAHAVHAQTLARLGRVGACESALDRALAAARKAGDRRRANAVLAGAPVAALWGPSPVTRASGRCLDVVRVLRITQGAPAVEAVALSCQGVLEALRGRTDAAKRMIALSRKMVEELGISHRLYEADVFAGRVALLEGDAVAAERCLRASCEGLRELGLGIDAARAAALLARALLALGRIEEAEALSHESELLAGDDLQAAIAWRGVRAEALAKRGEHAAAVEFARASVAIAAATDALLDHADARLALAAALRASGRAAEADAEEKRAIELWEAKGATLLAERARGSAATTTVPVAEPDARANQTSVPKSRRVHDNAATRNAAEFSAAIRTLNASAAADLLASDLVILHHPTGSTYDKAAFIADFQRGDEVAGLAADLVPLAGLGETLALVRAVVRGDSMEREDGASFGAFEIEVFLVVEVDGVGRRRLMEVFASDHLEHAIVRLYELHAERVPEGPARVRAETVAHSIRSLLGEAAHDWNGDRPSAIAPDVVFHDHRRTGTGKLVGAAALHEAFAAIFALATDLVWRVDDIICAGEYVLAMTFINVGTDKRSGGAFERLTCVIWAFGEDGLVHRWETFEPEQTAAVLARIDELLPAKPAPQLPTGRRVRPNAATRNVERFASTVTANDVDAGAALYADDVVNVHHATGISFGKASMVESWRASGVAENPACESEALASFGDTLCLARQLVRIEGVTREDSVSMGPIEHEMFLVVEVDEHGLRRRNELFAMDHLEDAIVRLYESRAESLAEGAERKRAAATAATVREMLAETHDLRRLATTLAPDLAYHDYRRTGPGKLVGAAAVLENLHAFEQLSSGMVWRYDEVLHLDECSLAVRGINTGKDNRGGGDFERRFAFLWKFGPDGLLTHMEVFEPEDAGRVVVRLDELAAPDTASLHTRGLAEPFAATQATRPRDEDVPGSDILPLSPWDNAASRVWRHLLHRWRTTGLQTSESLFAEDFHYSDRRRLSQLELDRDGFVVFNQVLREMPSRKLDASLLATRGERYCMLRVRIEVAGEDVGPSEIEHVNVVEVNESGAGVALLRFDLDDVDATCAELESRFQAAEALTHPRTAATVGRYARARDTRDWETLAAQFHPGMVTTDHRLLGWGTLHGRDAFVQTQKTLVDLAPDTRHRSHHVRSSEHGYLAGLVISGTRDGGPFELPSNTVMEIDPQGLICRVDIYDSEDHGRAFARFLSIDGATESDPPAIFPPTRAAPGATIETAANAADGTHAPDADHRSIPPNAATRTHAKLVEIHAARDWDGIRRLVSDDFRFEDRGKRVLVDGDVETWLTSMRFVSSQPGVRFESEYLATLGDRILLQRLSWIGESPEAEFLTDKLRVIELAADGRMRRVILFDLDDRPAAFSEALFAAAEAEGSDGAASYATLARALLRFDWSATREMLSPELVFDDRRPLSFGILNRDQWIVSLRVQSDMAPDLASEVTRVLAWNRHGFVGSLRIYGNLRDGGPFENVFLCVFLASGGKLVHVEPHPIDAVEEAVARFEELRSGLDGRILSGSSGFSPTSAAKAGTRFFEVLASEGDDRAAALVSPDFRYFDRGRRALLEGDVRTWIRSIRFMLSRSRVRFEVLATIGDRIQINRTIWTGREDGPKLELDRISLLETDDTGRLCSVTLFDLQDRSMAMWEGRERFSAGEAAGADAPTTYDAFGRAIQQRDWNAASEFLSPSLRFDDHRPLSLGVLDGKQWLESIRVAMDLAPDYGSEVMQVLAWNSRGYLLSLRFHGTLQGGGPFENVLLSIFVASGGKLTHVEPYPIDAQAEALARFEELTRDPFEIAPNAATRTTLRTTGDFVAGDWQVFRELTRADFRYEDRSRRALVIGDVETWITSMQFVREHFPLLRKDLSAQGEHELIATFGDRIELRRFLFVGDADGARVELERLRLTEVDEQGLLQAILFFDPEDRAAACLEGFRRFVTREAADIKPVVDFIDAVQRHDWEAVREVLSTDCVLDDHRPLSFGTIDREQWIASFVVQVEMAPDFTLEPLHVITCNRHGLVFRIRTYGTLRDGGPFENVMTGVNMTAGGRTTRAEPFPSDDPAKAVARFHELCAALNADAPDGPDGTPVTTASQA